MKDIVARLPIQIQEASEIGKNAVFAKPSGSIQNILVCGLGGSGIGGRIISQLYADELKVPFFVCSDYNIPSFVNENTLVIASSYSGNTEETLDAVGKASQKGAEIAVVTSGGKLLELAKQNGWNHAVVPGGEQPRAMLCYSLIQLVFFLNKYELVSDRYIQELDTTREFIASNSNRINELAKNLSEKLYQHIPVIYSDASFESVSVRFRQQLNENSKVLCWHHALPEMNHNELVGWAGGTDQLAVVYLSTAYDHPRTIERWKFTQKVASQKTTNINEIKAEGSSRFQQIMYLIHFTDWVSLHLSDLRKVDPVEVDIIIELKSRMADI